MPNRMAFSITFKCWYSPMRLELLDFLLFTLRLVPPFDKPPLWQLLFLRSNSAVDLLYWQHDLACKSHTSMQNVNNTKTHWFDGIQFFVVLFYRGSNCLIGFFLSSRRQRHAWECFFFAASKCKWVCNLNMVGTRNVDVVNIVVCARARGIW